MSYLNAVQASGNAGFIKVNLVAGAWANVDNTHDPLLRGQLYDSWIRTAPSPMDTTDTFDDGFWIAFTNVSKFGTLWLAVPGLTPVTLQELQASYAN